MFACLQTTVWVAMLEEQQNETGLCKIFPFKIENMI